MSTSTVYRPARARRRMPRPGIRSLVAVALITSAGAVTLDAMTPADARPAVAHVATAHDVDVFHAAAAGAPAPRPPAAKAAKKHHLPHVFRTVRHVHRVFRILRHPFRFWLW